MKRYAVGFMDFGDNNMRIEIVVAEDWQSALESAFPGFLENLSCVDLEDAKQEAFDQDWSFDVVEVLE